MYLVVKHTFVAGEDGEDGSDEAPGDLTNSPGQSGESGRC